MATNGGEIYSKFCNRIFVVYVLHFTFPISLRMEPVIRYILFKITSGFLRAVYSPGRASIVGFPFWDKLIGKASILIRPVPVVSCEHEVSWIEQPDPTDFATGMRQATGFHSLHFRNNRSRDFFEFHVFILHVFPLFWFLGCVILFEMKKSRKLPPWFLLKLSDYKTPNVEPVPVVDCNSISRTESVHVINTQFPAGCRFTIFKF